MKLSLLALLMIPLLLILQAPLLAAVVPGALLTVASLGSAAHDQRSLAPAAQVLSTADVEDLRRMAAATPIEARTTQVG
ncbi:hypothetical protein [Enhygromyxa salina]|uniref:hypothetical protein n=1 Tax=Enhygromyxa salina TaxID=215803 RepID=UPI000D037DB0|nr:hypothetical protein [Enhygromyxa salina]